MAAGRWPQMQQVQRAVHICREPLVDRWVERDLAGTVHDHIEVTRQRRDRIEVALQHAHARADDRIHCFVAVMCCERNVSSRTAVVISSTFTLSVC